MNARLDVVEASIVNLLALVESNFKVVIEKLCGSKPNSEETLNCVLVSTKDVTCIPQTSINCTTTLVKVLYYLKGMRKKI